MIRSTIFSFDRACQIDLLLRSIEINAKDVFNINVLYKYSNEEYKNGYEILKSRFPNVNWVEETDFKKQTLEIIDSDFEYVCFGVDDDVFFSEIKGEEEIINALKENQDAVCFSLRQGLNTNRCYTMRCDNIILPDKEDDKFIYWNWTTRYADASYWFSTDFHIFRTKDIKRMIKATNFNTPNTFEGNAQSVAETYPKEVMIAYKHSKVVNSPNNIVNTTHPNRVGEQFGISAKELNDKYLDGYIIDYDSIDFSAVNGAHCELKYGFKKQLDDVLDGDNSYKKLGKGMNPTCIIS